MGRLAGANGCEPGIPARSERPNEQERTAASRVSRLAVSDPLSRTREIAHGGPALRVGPPWLVGPLPWHEAGPPVLITAGNRGELLPAQFDRFARLGDGIITTYLHAEECRLVRERAEEALARHGRARPDFPLCVYTTVRLDDDPRTAERVTTEFLATYYGGGVHSRGTMGLGPADAVIAALRRYAAAGATDLCLRFVGDDQLAQLERFTTDVLPALRG